MKFQGIVMDGMKQLADKKTFWYDTYEQAHDAAESLCNMSYSGDRGRIDVVAATE